MDPAVLLRDSSYRARVLNASENHAVILLEKEQVQSLLKLNIIPFRQRFLTSNNNEDREEQESALIFKMLKRYNFHLSSESGAEYSYYRATPRSGFWNSLSMVWGLLLDIRLRQILAPYNVS